MLREQKIAGIHFLHFNSHQQELDKEIFKSLWATHNLAKSIKYHLETNFKVKKNEVVIIDEGDHFIFKDPKKFDGLIRAHTCFALTGTAYWGDERGPEFKVLKKLNFYLLPQIEEKFILKPDEEISRASLVDKIFQQKRPVLLFISM